MSRAAALAVLAAGLLPFAVGELLTGRRPTPPRGRAADALARLGRRLGVPVAPGDLTARLAAAGLDGAGRAAEMMAVKVGAGAVAVVLFTAVAAAAQGAWLAVVAAPAAGFLAPDLWLRQRVRERRRRMSLELPAVLDLLAVASEAGLAPTRALREVGRRHRGLLGAELQAASDRVALGLSFGEALERLEGRCPVPAAAALTVALRRAHRHGEPLAPALTALAAEVRAGHERALRDAAARAAPKVQLAVALLLVPAALLLVGAALAAALTG